MQFDYEKQHIGYSVRADCHATMDEISGERFVKLCAKI